MTAFAKIRRAAEKRLGAGALAARLPPVKSAAALRRIGDDRYFSLMARRIFRAGLKHEMVDAKWPAFERAFLSFEPRKVRAMSDEAVEKLLGDRRLIRHLGKLKAVHANAAAICDLVAKKGSVGDYLADWPSERIVDLWDDIAARFQQMGGNSAAYLLRMAGKDTFILTDAVVLALDHWGAFRGKAKGKKARAEVQAIFNAWAAETGLPLAHLSMIAAMSLD